MKRIDTLKDHIGDAGEQAASWHILTFLLWAADHDMLAPKHSAEKLRQDPHAYFQSSFAAELCEEDLTAEGAAFARANWKRYLDDLTDLAMTHDLPDAYA